MSGKPSKFGSIILYPLKNGFLVPQDDSHSEKYLTYSFLNFKVNWVLFYFLWNPPTFHEIIKSSSLMTFTIRKTIAFITISTFAITYLIMVYQLIFLSWIHGPSSLQSLVIWVLKILKSEFLNFWIRLKTSLGIIVSKTRSVFMTIIIGWTF